MASASYGLNVGAEDQPADIALGSLAVSSNDIELRVDLTAGATTKDIILALQAFIRRLEDGRFGPADFLTI